MITQYWGPTLVEHLSYLRTGNWRQCVDQTTSIWGWFHQLFGEQFYTGTEPSAGKSYMYHTFKVQLIPVGWGRGLFLYTLIICKQILWSPWLLWLELISLTVLPLLCRYHLTCGDPDSIMYLHFVTHELESKKSCGKMAGRCVDYVELGPFFGSMCTLCGEKLRCCETPAGPELPNAIALDGNTSIMLKFQSNRLLQFPGFDYIAVCIKKDYFSVLRSSPEGQGRSRSAVVSRTKLWQYS